MLTFRTLTLISVNMAALCISMPVNAQDSDSNNAGIGDIVVTAQKRAENVQDVPIAIDHHRHSTDTGQCAIAPEW